MKYYFLAAYLPEIHRDDTKIRISLSELLEERFHIPKADWREIELVLLGRDIIILDSLLKGKDLNMEHSIFSLEFWKEQIKSPQEGPEFIQEFLTKWDRETFGVKDSDRLRAAYFNHVISNTANSFLRDYFIFQRDLYNILAAKRARKIGLEPAEYIIGEGDLTEKLKTSTAEDFGLEEEEFPWLEDLNKAETPHQQQETLDRILWEYLDENSGPDIFHFNVILAYLLKLEILHKRLALGEEEGMEKVRRFGGV